MLNNSDSQIPVQPVNSGNASPDPANTSPDPSKHNAGKSGKVGKDTNSSGNNNHSSGSPVSPLASLTQKVVPFTFKENPIWFSTFVTLAGLIAGGLGYFLALLIYHALGLVPSLQASLPAIGEIVFTSATTLVPAALLYYVVVRNAPALVLPGLALPSGQQGWLSVLGYGSGAVALAYVFDYLTGSSVLLSVAPTGPGSVVSAATSADAAVQFGQIIQQQVGFDEAGNYQIQFLRGFGLHEMVYTSMALMVAPLAEEFICRGVLLPLWRGALLRLDLFYDESLRPVAVASAVLISALVFALPHGEGLLSQFFFGILLAAVYLRTGNIWAGVWAHLVNNALVALFLFT